MRNAPTIPAFVFACMPEIHFGAGALSRLPSLVGAGGKRFLLVTGSSSFRQSAHYERLTAALGAARITTFEVSVSGEPSPAFVDEVVARYRNENPDWVVSIGGGSALDAGKAISAMLPSGDSVVEYLECKDTKKHDGRKVPFIAIPTSSGTGAEATKNAPSLRTDSSFPWQERESQRTPDTERNCRRCLRVLESRRFHRASSYARR